MNRFFLTVLLLFFQLTFVFSQSYWKPADSPGNGNIQELAINSQGDIFGGCFDGLFKSTDNGESWMQLSPTAFSENPNIKAIAVNSADEIFVGATTSGGFLEGKIFKSTDGGNSWGDVTGSFSGSVINTIALDASDNVFIGTNNGIHKSTDGGTNWNVLSNFPQGVFVNDILVDDNGIVLCGAGNGVYQSTDGGENWEAINTGLTSTYIQQLALGPSAEKENLTELFVATLGGGVFKFDRVANAWIAYVTGLTTLYVYSLAFNSSGDLFAGTDVGLFVHLAAAATWTLLNVPTLTTLFIAAILINNLDHIFLAEDWGGIHRSVDGGVTWLRKNLLLTAYAIHLLFYSSAIQTLFLGSNMGFWFREAGSAWAEITAPFSFFWVTAMAATSTYLFAATAFQGVWRLTRSSGEWTEINNGLTNFFATAIVITAIGHLFVGTSGGVFRSINNGELWEEFNVGLTSLFITALVVHPLGYLFAATSNGGVFRMDLAILTWVAVITGLTNNNVRTLEVNSDGDIFAGTDGDGVFKTTDLGILWVPVTVGLTIYTIHHLVFRRGIGSENTGELYAVGGGTIFLSTDNGDTWSEERTGIEGNNITSVGADSSGGVYIGTQGGGIYQHGVATTIRQIDNNIPGDYFLEQNFPNPFNPSTTFSFGLSKSGYTELKIYNALGEVVQTLVNKELPAGNYNFNWDAGDMPSGVYFYRLNSGKLNQTKKAMLIK